MEISVIQSGPVPKSLVSTPRAVLRRDNWDDYGFKTMFDLIVFPSGDTEIDAGKVKILGLGQTEGRVPIPSSFETLGPQFISLGQDFDYYDTLRRLGDSVYRPLLEGLNDIVFRPELRQRFEQEPGYQTSLLRFSSAESALDTARSLFDETSPAEPRTVTLSVRTNVGGDPFTIEFEWDRTSELPGHLAAVIGYNGTGKTQLLANLAFVAAKTGVNVDAAEAARRGELLVNSIGTFSGVIAVSYSAFDTFALPAASSIEAARIENTGSNFGYTYVGLRKPGLGPAPTGEESVQYELKSPAELVADFRIGLERARTKERVTVLDEALSVLMQEPSFSGSGLQSGVFADGDDAVALFELLSTGHKVVLNLVVHLVSQLQPRTLVLIDEPESHLHPPLVAALLAAISAVVKRYDSLAIIATHSPVVIQEIPARHVRVLRRIGVTTVAETLDTESFAENVGYLTRIVFNLDSSATDFQRVLRSLLQTHSSEEIDEMFVNGLSQQGRAILATLEAAAGDDVQA